MLDVLLIDREDLQRYKQISPSNNNDKLNQTIIETQLEELKPLLGEKLFNAVLSDVRTSGSTDGSTYTNLLNGGNYTYNGNEYYNPGIKVVLANYVYGAYIMWGDVIDNPFGATRKLNNNSEPIDMATKKSLYIKSKNFAFNLWNEVRRFLILTEEPLFNTKCSQRVGGFKLRKVTNKPKYRNRHGYYNKRRKY